MLIMPRRTSRWKWPLCTVLALSLALLTAWVTPRSWIFLMPRAAPADGRSAGHAPWRGLVLVPPPQVVVIPDRSPPAEPKPRPQAPPAVGAEDPRWWTAGWGLQTLARSQAVLLGPGRPSARDSAEVLLKMLAVPGDLLTLARPDSVLAARLLWASLQETFSLQELKPYLAAMTRAAVYADIQAQAADLYDDFLRQEIRTPD